MFETFTTTLGPVPSPADSDKEGWSGGMTTSTPLLNREYPFGSTALTWYTRLVPLS